MRRSETMRPLSKERIVGKFVLFDPAPHSVRVEPIKEVEQMMRSDREGADRGARDDEDTDGNVHLSLASRLPGTPLGPKDVILRWPFRSSTSRCRGASLERVVPP